MAKTRTIIWLAAATSILLAGDVFAATFVVDSTGNESDQNLNDGVCQTASGTCTLRAAIQQADAATDFDTVDLTGISGTVSPGPALIFGNPVAIVGSNNVTVDGSSLVSTTLRLNAPGSSVTGVNFVNVPRAEIVVDGTRFESNSFVGTSQILVKAPNAVVTGNSVVGATDPLASIYVTPGGTGSVIEANTVGILADGSAENATPIVGIYTEASDVLVSSNQVASHTYGIAGARGTGVTYYKNLVGGADGTMGAAEYGIWSIGLQDSVFDSNTTNGNALGGLVFTNGSGNHAAGNVAHGNGGPGILVMDEVLSVVDSSVENNSSGIRTNLSGSVFNRNRAVANSSAEIDVLGDGDTVNTAGDGVTNHPALSTATGGAAISIDGQLDAEFGNTGYTIEFFESSSCDPVSQEGSAETFLGSINVTTGADGSAPFAASFAQAVAAGKFITATATGGVNGTSELSKCVEVLPGADPTIDVEFYKLNAWVYNPRSWKPLIGIFLGSDDLDVNDIELNTLRLGNASPSVAIYADLNRDGHQDLVVAFIGRFTGASAGDTELELTGEVTSGATFTETLGIRLVGTRGKANGADDDDDDDDDDEED